MEHCDTATNPSLNQWRLRRAVAQLRLNRLPHLLGIQVERQHKIARREIGLGTLWRRRRSTNGFEVPSRHLMSLLKGSVHRRHRQRAKHVPATQETAWR